MNASLAVAICLHDDDRFLEPSVVSFAPAGPVYAFVSRSAWNGTVGDWQRTAEIVRRLGATVVEGEWLSEAEHRAFALNRLQADGFEFAFIPDGDEIIERCLLDRLIKIAQNDLADRVSVCWDTYWKDTSHVIRPREGFTPLILLKIDAVHQVFGRHFEGGRHVHLSADHGLIHHLSYAGSDERIKRKIETWGHRDEVVPGWFNRVWKAWDENPFLTNLHPTHPPAYHRAERIPVVKELREVCPEITIFYQEPTAWPSVSIVIPLCGQREAFARCLDSLEDCRELWRETVVVDNASPDGAAEVAKKRNGVRIVQNPENAGLVALIAFAICNLRGPDRRSMGCASVYRGCL